MPELARHVVAKTLSLKCLTTLQGMLCTPMNKIDFKTSNYFSSRIIIVGIIFSFCGLLLLSVNLVIGLVLLLSSVIIFTTQYRLAIDFENKIFHDYVLILGLKNGYKEKFETIEYVFIKSGNSSQTMSMGGVASTTIHSKVYNGYLKFSANNKIHLTTKDDKKSLYEVLTPIANKLNVKIVDYTEAEA
jgi:hypothetical protein